ncbi:fimbrial biogenesis outer membrane usher protein [Enterobacteriaceae bacterium 89]|nr:fimbrial biogenesis outer membrane usher protein [Enterobacteriaceae bacterium 89]
MSNVKTVCRLGLVICFALHTQNAAARYNFELGFFNSVGISDDVDLSLFNQGATFLPGNYQLAVYINDAYITQRSINFINSPSGGEPQPCLSEQDLDSLGIALPYESISGCVTPKAEDNFFWRTDMGAMRLMLTLPQIYTRHSEIFKSPWQSWQNGVTAALFNYDYSYSENRNRNDNSTSQYLGLEGGINLLGFRLRNSSVWTQNTGKSSEFNTLRTYAQRDFHYLQGGELTVGQTWSDGSLFESIPFKGVTVASMDDMLKDEYRAFVPAVRGVVNSQSATVSVKKNGRTLYQTDLPAGPFSLDGIMSNGGGDYLIEIKESDGNIRSYVQSSESLPEMQSKGRLKYAFSSGRSDIHGAENEYFNQATLFYGLDYGLTAYGGALVASDYQAYSLGFGKMTEGLGAISLDLTTSVAKDLEHHDPDHGYSVRASYYKDFDYTGSSFGLFAYRYSSKGYLDFDEFLEYSRHDARVENKKNRFEASLNQSLGTFGSLQLNGHRDTYWTGRTTNLGYRINHSVSKGRYALNTYYERSQTVKDKRDTVLGMSLSVAWYDRGRSAMLSERLTRDNGRYSSQTSLNINPLQDNSLNLGLSTGKTESESGMYGLSAQYTGHYSELSTGYYKSENSSRLNAGIRGGGLIHAGGITAGKKINMNSPVALVDTNGISNITISNGIGNITDGFGHALVSNLQSYQRNQISIDTVSLNSAAEAPETDKIIVPAKGSVIPVKFKVKTGGRVLFDVYRQGKIIPLGALATVVGDENEPTTAFFADRGQVYLTGLQKKGLVRVNWGRGGNSSCQFSFDLSEVADKAMHTQRVECQ